MVSIIMIIIFFFYQISFFYISKKLSKKITFFMHDTLYGKLKIYSLKEEIRPTYLFSIY